MKNVLLSFLMILSFTLMSQDKPTVAFLTNKTTTGNYQKQIHDAIVDNLSKSDRVDFLHYWYNSRYKTRGIQFDATKNGDRPEAPAEFLFFITNTLDYNKKPDVQFRVDTLNNIKSAYYKLSFKSNILYKVIDFRTSEIVAVNNLESSGFGKGIRPNIIEVKDFNKYFGRNKNSLKGSKMRAAQNAARAAYQKQITAKYEKALSEAMKGTKRMGGIIAGLIDPEIYEITGPAVAEVEKKLVDFTANFGSNDAVKKHDAFYVYQVLEYDQGNATNVVAMSYVKELSESSSQMRTYPFQRKKLADAYKSGNKLMMVRNKRVVEEMNTLNKQKYRLAVDKACLFCDIDLETKLGAITNVVLIERGHLDVMKFLSERYKGEQFLDFDLDDFQSKQQGVEILIDRASSNISMTEIATGKVIDTGAKVYGSSVTTALLNHSNSKIGFIKTQKEKKNKIVEVLIYHPFGFFQGDRVDIAEVQIETFKGKTMERNEPIGTGMITRVISPNIAILRLTDGKKELYSAIQKDSQINYIPFINDKKGGGLLNKLEGLQNLGTQN